MRFGLCADISEIKTVEDAGFDYIELSASKVAALSDEDFHRLVDTLNASQIKAEAFNVLLPGGISLGSERFNVEQIREYLTGAFKRMSALGAKIVVFGSGGARSLEAGYDRNKAISQVYEFLRIASEISNPLDITLVIEPLRAGECNYINFVSEAVEIVNELKLPNLKALADLYHVASGDEPIENIAAAGSLLMHAHIARLDGRTYPMPGDGFNYEPFFNALKQIKYANRLSIEGKSPTSIANDAAASLAFLRRLANN